MIFWMVFSLSATLSSSNLESQDSEKAFPRPLGMRLRKMYILASSEYLSLWRAKYPPMAKSHLLASAGSPENSSGRAALISPPAMLSSSSSPLELSEKKGEEGGGGSASGITMSRSSEGGIETTS